MTDYKLIYFDMMGRAEASRLMFAYAGVPYEDERIAKEKWPQLKAEMPMGQLPVLVVDGKMLCQTHSIERYLAKQFDLMAKNDWDNAVCDMFIDAKEDLMPHFLKWFMESDATKKEGLWKELAEKHVGPYIAKVDAQLKANGTGYLVGDKVTWADIVLFNTFAFWAAKMPEIAENFPETANFLKKIGSIPELKKWIETRPKTDW